MEQILASWSGGKDCFLALYKVLSFKRYEVVTLLTTIKKEKNVVSAHNVPYSLLEKQAESIGFPIDCLEIKPRASNIEYEEILIKTLKKYANNNVKGMLFGDISLKDVKEYREKILSEAGIKGIFPLWKKNTWELAHNFINLKFKAIITFVDSNVLDKKFLGKDYNSHFLNNLPSGVDPCGENGEFHTFVYDGPLFKRPITKIKKRIFKI